MKSIITAAVKTFGYTVKDILSFDVKDLKGKIYLNKGRGCIYLEGWVEEIRRKRQADGSLSMYRVRLPEPRWRVRINNYAWKLLN